jgi:lipoprotein-anchoring transpeptidase ErfK/SrfK
LLTPDRRPPKNEEPFQVVVDCGRQRLHLYRGRELQASYPVSTATSGLGSAEGSNRTPLGRHRVAQKFGEGAPLGTVFVARKSTGRIAPILTEDVDVPEDLVLTRILWLEGLEPGLNRGPGVDSHDRYIYIHGTNEEGLIGRPASHGCVRMLNRDVIELFDLLPVGALVELRR